MLFLFRGYVLFFYFSELSNQSGERLLRAVDYFTESTVKYNANNYMDVCFGGTFQLLYSIIKEKQNYARTIAGCGVKKMQRAGGGV